MNGVGGIFCVGRRTIGTNRSLVRFQGNTAFNNSDECLYYMDEGRT